MSYVKYNVTCIVTRYVAWSACSTMSKSTNISKLSYNLFRDSELSCPWYTSFLKIKTKKQLETHPFLKTMQKMFIGV